MKTIARLLLVAIFLLPSSVLAGGMSMAGAFATPAAAGGGGGYSDTFTGADGTALATHDANWTSIDTTYAVTKLEINTNQVRFNAWDYGGGVL